MTPTTRFFVFMLLLFAWTITSARAGEPDMAGINAMVKYAITG